MQLQALVTLLAVAEGLGNADGGGAAAPTEKARAILPPKKPLPSEAASAAVTRFSFIVYGDTRGRRDGKEVQHEHSLVVDSILGSVKRLEATAHPVKFVLMTGDAVVSGHETRQWNVSFVELVNRVTQGPGLPYFLSPGNHDVTFVGPAPLDPLDRGPGFRNYLSVVADLVPRDGHVRRLRGYPTYAFGYGNVFVVALDSNIANDDRQYTWIAEQLAGADARRYRHRVAFFHHPVFSSGPHGGTRVETPTAHLRRRYMPLFRRHRVNLLFAGHEHLFEHWVERHEDQGKRYRIDQIVTGGGGAPLYAFQGRPDLREYLAAGASAKVTVQQLVRPGTARGDNPYHYVVVQVDGARVGVEVIGVDWGTDFQPYRSRGASLVDEVPVPVPPPAAPVLAPSPAAR